MTEISISNGNIKLGNIPSISLPPQHTCGNRACASQCYARRMNKYRPGTVLAWERNWNALNEGSYMGQIYDWLNTNKDLVTRFRWHVGGDIPHQDYLNDMIDIAKCFPHTKFLAFTKAYGLHYRDTLTVPNLSIIISMWPNVEGPIDPITNSLPKAWMYDKNNIDSRIPKNAHCCTSNCSTCFGCWELKNSVCPHVVFIKH